jgi:hypothetical protein
MLSREKAITALERKRPHFQAYLTEQRKQQTRLDATLVEFLSLSKSQIEAMLDQLNINWPGARPTFELDQADRLCMPFAAQWANHEEARNWARETLLNRTVLAVDGSQIIPTKDISIPIGAIQVGWFINDHAIEGRYVKDVEFDVIAPGELQGSEEEGESGFANWYINQQRFVGECRKLCELIMNYADHPIEAKPVAFFDGSFIISFASPMLPRRSDIYLQAVNEVLTYSERSGVPVVGFVDGSFSRDLVGMIDNVMRTGSAQAITDTMLAGPLLPHWGDRTPFFICARDDAMSREGRAPFYEDVVFTYVRLTADRLPARVEMPRWVMESGRAESVIDAVRAECIIGLGYPYAIETADAVAVMNPADRERFTALFQQFVEQEGLHITLARKALSKQQRRV